MDKNEEEIVKIFAKYREVLKPLIAEIEALNQRFPVGVLNEIRSCFDHIARYYAGSSDADENVRRASGHISRAIFDSYKFLIVVFHDQIENFLARNRNKDWSTVDGGRFNSKLHSLWGFAKNQYVEAKRQPDSEQNWLKAYHAYREVSCFLEEPKNVLSVDEGKNRETWMNKLFWVFAGALIGCGLSLGVAAWGDHVILFFQRCLW